VTSKPPIPAIVIGAILSLLAGYVVLEFVTAGIVLMWETIPESLGGTPWWYVVLVPLIAALLVFTIRKHVGDAGHSPMAGIHVAPLTPKEYLGAILAIVVSLLGGAVLGPEVALVSTGAVIGGLVAKWMKVEDSKKVVGASAAGAILALFVNPLLSGSSALSGPPESVAVDQLLWAVAVALVVTVVITLARFAAGFMSKATGGGPHLGILIASALVISISAIIVNSWFDVSYAYIATSGEEMISSLPTLTSAATVAAIVIFKGITYAVSLGAGFRGGPFFPAMFIGAATGLLFSLIIPDGPAVVAAITVGIVAAVIATAPMKWVFAIGLGVVLGYLFGGWTLVPAAVLGAVIARAIPRAEKVHQAV
jgi:H+/Cl- antiporter ClcA